MNLSTPCSPGHWRKVKARRFDVALALEAGWRYVTVEGPVVDVADVPLPSTMELLAPPWDYFYDEDAGPLQLVPRVYPPPCYPLRRPPDTILFRRLIRWGKTGG